MNGEDIGGDNCARDRARGKVWRKIFAMVLVVLPFGLFPTVAPSISWAADVFGTDALVPETPIGILATGRSITPCVFQAPASPLRLEEAVDRALCENPKTREAWANVKVQAAAVGAAKGAYLPTLSASGQEVLDDAVTNVTDHPALSSSNRSFVHTASVSLNWVLYDFGGRKAALDNAQALLEAAKANEDVALRSALAAVAMDYYAAQAASGKFVIARETEDLARDTFAAATARVSHGVAPITDQLQAQTSFAQAIFARAKAAGDLQIALGTLLSDMNLRPDWPLTLPDVADGITPDSEATQTIAALIDEAVRYHPSVAAAKAQLDAAAAKEAQTRAQGMPSISLVTKYSRNNQPATLGLGEPQFPATGHEWYVGVQVQIPLFEGFTRTYQIRQAQAQVEVQRYTLDDARREVGLDVWKSYQTLQTDVENLANTMALLDISKKSFDAARHRYAMGVGNIIELLNSQASMADANKQRVQALTDWRAARLQLAAKMGRLNLDDVQNHLR